MVTRFFLLRVYPHCGTIGDMVAKAKTTKEKRKHSADLHIRVEPEHLELFEKAAAEAGLNQSNWIRSRLLAAAKKELGK